MNTTIKFCLIIFLVFSKNVFAENNLQLSDVDFVVAEVSFGIDSDLVKKRLGKPYDISQYPYHNDPSAKYYVWKYNGLNITIDANNTVSGITILSNKFSTSRGLTVGSSKEYLIQLYGKPSATYNNDWDYMLGSDDLTVMRVTLDNTKIESIYLGYIRD